MSDAANMIDRDAHQLFLQSNPSDKMLEAYCFEDASVQHRETAYEYTIVIPYSGSFPIQAWVDWLRAYVHKHFPANVRYTISLAEPQDFGRATYICAYYVKYPGTHDGWADCPDKTDWYPVVWDKEQRFFIVIREWTHE